VAPEVARKSYRGEKCDLWSGTYCYESTLGRAFLVLVYVISRSHSHGLCPAKVGVICYLILSDKFPFRAESQDELFRMIVAGDVTFPSATWGALSEDAADFVKQLLTVDPEQRPSAQKALAHPWLQVARRGRTSKAATMLETDDPDELEAQMEVQVASIEAMSVLGNLQKFSPNKLQEATKTFVASQLLLSEEKKAIDQVFRELGRYTLALRQHEYRTILLTEHFSSGSGCSLSSQ